MKSGAWVIVLLLGVPSFALGEHRQPPPEGEVVATNQIEVVQLRPDNGVPSRLALDGMQMPVMTANRGTSRPFVSGENYLYYLGNNQYEHRRVDEKGGFKVIGRFTY